MGSPFAPNEVPAPVLQRRFSARPQKVWGHGTVSRSDGLWRIQGSVWRKPGAVRTLQPASFKHKNNTLQLCSHKNKFWKIEQLHKILFVKKKNTAHAAQRWILSGETAAKWIGCVAGQLILSWTFPHWSGGSHGDNQPLSVPVFKMNTTTSCGWLVTNPQEQWDLQEKYHCMWNSSRGIWKIYGSKV